MALADCADTLSDDAVPASDCAVAVSACAVGASDGMVAVADGEMTGSDNAVAVSAEAKVASDGLDAVSDCPDDVSYGAATLSAACPHAADNAHNVAATTTAILRPALNFIAIHAPMPLRLLCAMLCISRATRRHSASFRRVQSKSGATRRSHRLLFQPFWGPVSANSRVSLAQPRERHPAPSQERQPARRLPSWHRPPFSAPLRASSFPRQPHRR